MIHRPRLQASALPRARAASDGRLVGPGPEEWLRAWGDLPGFALLDSGMGQLLPAAPGAPAPPRARWSLAGLGPLADRPPPQRLSELRAFLAQLEPGQGGVPGPFQGGFLGALSYDLGVLDEALDLPRDPWCTPPIVGGLVTDFALHDHHSGWSWLVLDAAADDGRAPVGARRAELLERLAHPSEVRAAGGVGELVREVPSAVHRARVEAVRDAIGRGEVYQANVAHALRRATEGHPRELYRRLRRANPGAYLGYLAWGGGAAAPEGALLSASPELLLECVGTHARTMPIKGTAARGRDEEDDARARAELLASAKERAELAMIVDLERNDLGRVARAGGVSVHGFPTLETYRGVHHLVAEVRAELASGRTGLDALLALFPGGSITGAPKLRSMELIAELEGQGRGFFSGALGFLDRRGDARFSILIRTLVWRARAGSGSRAGEVRLHVGGGITWGSRAEDEERETLAKAATLVAALEDAEELDADLRGP